MMLKTPINRDLTTTEVAEMLHCSSRTVCQLCGSGKIAHSKRGPEHLISPQALRDYMESNDVPLDIAGQVVLTSGQVTSILSCAPRTVTKFCDSKQLRHHHVGSDRRILARDLLAFMRERNIPADINNQQVLTTGQAASIVQSYARKIDVLCDSGEIKHHHIGMDRRICKTDLVDYVARHPDQYGADILKAAQEFTTAKPVKKIAAWEEFLQKHYLDTLVDRDDTVPASRQSMLKTQEMDVVLYIGPQSPDSAAVINGRKKTIMVHEQELSGRGARSNLVIIDASTMLMQDALGIMERVKRVSSKTPVFVVARDDEQSNIFRRDGRSDHVFNAADESDMTMLPEIVDIKLNKQRHHVRQ